MSYPTSDKGRSTPAWIVRPTGKYLLRDGPDDAQRSKHGLAAPGHVGEEAARLVRLKDGLKDEDGALFLSGFTHPTKKRDYNCSGRTRGQPRQQRTPRSDRANSCALSRGDAER